MASFTATIIPVTVYNAKFELELVDTDNGSDFYAVLDLKKNEFLKNQWVRVPTGSVAEDVESAFLRGELVSSL